MASSELTSSRQFLREWQKETAGDGDKQKAGAGRTVQAKFIPRKVFLEHDFKEETHKWEVEQSAERSPKDVPMRLGESFKKVAGSNPAQVRQQFLQYAMGNEADNAENRKPSATLRPAKEVLKRLNYDSEYNPGDYVIGYIDRKAGILETSATSWKEFQQEDLIAYFKYVPENVVVWDRARKIDVMFNKS